MTFRCAGLRGGCFAPRAAALRRTLAVTITPVTFASAVAAPGAAPHTGSGWHAAAWASRACRAGAFADLRDSRSANPARGAEERVVTLHTCPTSGGR
eukprot:scaffold74610_cov42-Phaeocystis_antarctica.AAC.1